MPDYSIRRPQDVTEAEIHSLAIVFSSPKT